MANAKLNISLGLTTPGQISGIFGLNTNVANGTTIDDTVVSSQTVTIGTGADTTIVPHTDGHTYVYIRNLDNNNYLLMKRDDSGADYARLYPGDFAFLCTQANNGLKVIANTADCIIEYATFKRA